MPAQCHSLMSSNSVGYAESWMFLMATGGDEESIVRMCALNDLCVVIMKPMFTNRDKIREEDCEYVEYVIDIGGLTTDHDSAEFECSKIAWC